MKSFYLQDAATNEFLDTTGAFKARSPLAPTAKSFATEELAIAAVPVGGNCVLVTISKAGDAIVKVSKIAKKG